MEALEHIVDLSTQSAVDMVLEPDELLSRRVEPAKVAAEEHHKAAVRRSALDRIKERARHDDTLARDLLIVLGEFDG